MRPIFLPFLFFYHMMMNNLNILSAMKKMTIKELKYFKFGNYYRRIRFTKENKYYLMKRKNKKYLLLLAAKLIKKYHQLVKNIINQF